jgi:hypothetical protein
MNGSLPTARSWSSIPTLKEYISFFSSSDKLKNSSVNYSKSLTNLKLMANYESFEREENEG